jgi:hypothetical protein
MKKYLLLGILSTVCSSALFAQVGIDNSAPPPPPASVNEAPAPPPTPPPPTVTAPAVTTTYTAPAPVYKPANDHKVDINRLRFGAFIAPNLSWMKPTAATDDEKQYNVSSDGTKLGFTYGLMADYFFAENYGFVTGLQINSTGGKVTSTAIDKNKAPDKVMKATFDYRLQYLEVPLALKLRTDDISGFHFFGQLGITAAFNIGKKADYSVDYYGDTATTLLNKSDTKAKLTGSLGHIAPVLFQMNIGAGAEYLISNKLTAYFGLFFNNGFAPDATKPDLFDEDNLGYKGTFRDANTRLNNFSLRVGLFF